MNRRCGRGPGAQTLRSGESGMGVGRLNSTRHRVLPRMAMVGVWYGP